MTRTGILVALCEMAALVLAHDWSVTPLGPIENWTRIRRVIVDTVLGSGLGSTWSSRIAIPGMSGLDLARSIRRRCSDLPVVLTSGYSHVLAQYSTDSVEFLRKPY